MSNRNRNYSQKPANPWNRNNTGTQVSQSNTTSSNVERKKQNNKPASVAPADNLASSLKQSEQRFKQAHQKNVESARKYTQQYESSDEEDGSESASQEILGNILKNYNGLGGDVGKTSEYLQHLLESRSAVCLICIGTVKRADAIWSCGSCYTFFHLMCIQRWANDSISLKRISHEQQEGYYNNRGEYVPKPVLSVHWDCPKCRKEYEPVDIPRHYECFCKKELTPQNHLWLIPHSCGETCRKPLVPECGHSCVLLCHPGPCPPCPQIINVSCLCKQSGQKTIRCSQRSWTCLKKCKRKRNCGIHECEGVCHDPENCPPCKSRSKKPCLCGNKTKEVDCSDSAWQCGKVCGRSYPCGLHSCEQQCHAGDCGACPLGLPRTCPCGKTSSVAACSEDIGTCGDTCQKYLECGEHLCSERCHPGKCGQCLELVKKTCRCGFTTKVIACHKQLSCENKCKNLRSCGKHRCNRKCCNSQCPPCDKVCGKTLACGKHKCSSMCHHGPCYPCNQKATVKCRCAGTLVEVPCGREKKISTPKCKLPCRIPSKCHHLNPHNCHQDDCPSCQQVCGLPNDTTKCEHPCWAKCHDAVRVVTKDKNFVPAGPWDAPTEIVEIKQLPHPECEVKVPVTCIGQHETAQWPCYNSKPASCGRECGRQLKCGVHKCPLPCHSLKRVGASMLEEDPRCQSCSADCAVPRPAGCTHPCKRPCHPPPCNPCQAPTKTTCHCGLTQMFYKCCEYYADDIAHADLLVAREQMLSCGQKCIKNFPCGHRCNSICHSGDCPNSELCNKKVKVTCPCRHRRMEVSCGSVRAQSQTHKLECDASCQELQAARALQLNEKEMAQKQAEEAENRRALEEYEKKFSDRRKHRERKKVQQEEIKETNWVLYGGISAGVVLVALVVYFLLQ
ncbi:NF-X1-type zinc finger protein NFXL1 [Uranotaenia lowii]|uniref:NF-X1-type zinc finger protein NFXL1 n=1 Tax=Uranotaenia lowii TaxID=190385 RepID=UPI002479F222|nr:NF-X1-type zinc finger protein NFXL1 [Uranotaenia lowii]